METIIKIKRIDRIKTIIKENKPSIIAWTIFLLGPFISYIAVEYMDENNPFTSLKLWQVAWNLLWYYCIYGITWTLIGRKRSAAISASSLMFIFGIANHYVLRFRGRALFPTDILTIKTAANVADAFDFTPDIFIYIAAAITVLYIITVIFLAKKEVKRPRARFRVISAVLWLGFLYAFFCTPLLPSIDLYAQQWVTTRNGFLLNFTVSLRYSFVSEPDNYNKDKIADIQTETFTNIKAVDEAYVLATPGLDDDKLPTNIIVIMNESFADYSIYENFKSTSDPLEFYHGLTENTVKGYIYSPVTGGGTANVEYEFLTGNSTAFLPDGTVAYQLYVNDDTPSYALLTKQLGYSTYAFHPYLSSGWNRIAAYDKLGFEHQLYVEDVKNPEEIRHYISDESDYDTIKCIEGETTEKIFFFNVTMQNHSGYKQGWNNLYRSVHLAKTVDFETDPVTQYLSLAYESDQALKELIEYYEDYDEPTLIVFFGDHQPPLSNEFYSMLYGKELKDLTSEELLKEYLTPFLVWANYDIEERQDVYISPNYLGLLMAEAANIPLTGYTALQTETMLELPVIHEIGYITSNGDFINKANKLSKTQKNALDRYHNMVYYTIFDRDKEEDQKFYIYD